MTSSPTVLFYENGKPVATYSGAIKRKDLVRQLDAMLPAETSAAIRGRTPHRTTETALLILGSDPVGLAITIGTAPIETPRIPNVFRAVPGISASLRQRP